MDDDRVDIPTSILERLVSDKRRLAAVGGGALFLVMLLAWALLAGPLARDRTDWDATAPVDLDVIDESVETTAAGGVEASDEATGADSAEDLDAPDDTAADDNLDNAHSQRAALVVYRQAGVVWVAAEDGSAARKIASSPAGAYALSPDGSTLAWVDSAAHVLHLADIASGRDTVVGPAEDVRPAWHPDSSQVAYTGVSGGRLHARIVAPTGRDARDLGIGHSPTVGPDGSVVFIASVAPGALGPVVTVNPSGKSAEIKVSASAVAFGGDGLLWATYGSGAGSERIMTSRVDGSAAREVIGGSGLSRQVTYSTLCVSPAGGHLLYAATGDDGFSRTYVTTLDSPSPVSLGIRRDTYPHTWSADGLKVFFIEGNTFQGEKSALLRADHIGLGRVTVVADAEL